MSEVFGAKSMIYIKDEDGLYDKDPKKHDDAKLFGNVTLGELNQNLPEETILDRTLFDAWKTARHVEKIHIVNGLKPGQFTSALKNEDIGTVITRGPKQ